MCEIWVECGNFSEQIMTLFFIYLLNVDGTGERFDKTNPLSYKVKNISMKALFEE